MVFFICNQCGSCIKKPQVDKHRFQCRSAGGFSCMDCNKDFKGDEYRGHIKCITEEEKYSGVGWKAPPGHLKGEKKQMSWTETIRMASSDSKLTAHLDASTRRLLQDLTKHDNIPRKKPKFMNFIKNTTRNRFDEVAFEKVWAVLEAQMKSSQPEDKRKTPSKNSNSANGDAAEEAIGKKESSNESGNAGESLQDPSPQENGESENSVKKSKKKKKSKHKEENCVAEEQTNEEVLSDQPQLSNSVEEESLTVLEDCSEDMLSKKKKKKKSKRKEGSPAVEEQVVEEDLSSEPKKKKSKRNEENLLEAEEIVEDSKTKSKKKKSKLEEEISAVVDEEVIEDLPRKSKKKKSKHMEEDSFVTEEEIDETLSKKSKKKKSKDKEKVSDLTV